MFAYGHFAVAVFIVLSGFCLALAVCRDGALRGGASGFLRRRARRLLLPFYCADMLGGGQVNHVFWSVAVEWQISLLFPLLVLVWLKRRLAAAATLGLVASVVVTVLTLGDPHVGPFVVAGLTPQFLACSSSGCWPRTSAPRQAASDIRPARPVGRSARRHRLARLLPRL